jgi:CheY-like chemotaxis protein
MLGYKDISSASDGLQGFEKAEKTHYDVILMDLQMPVMDGYTALERIKASPLTGQPCVVALTANADVVSGIFINA